MINSDFDGLKLFFGMINLSIIIITIRLKVNLSEKAHFTDTMCLTPVLKGQDCSHAGDSHS